MIPVISHVFYGYRAYPNVHVISWVCAFVPVDTAITLVNCSVCVTILVCRKWICIYSTVYLSLNMATHTVSLSASVCEAVRLSASVCEAVSLSASVCEAVSLSASVCEAVCVCQ